MTEFEVKLIAIRGDQRDALRELRRLTGRPISQLAESLKSLPTVIRVGTRDEVVHLLNTATDLLQLEVWQGGVRSREVVPTCRVPHVAQRVEVDVGPQGVCFPVDDVTPADAPRRSIEERELWSLRVGGDAVHVGRDRTLTEPGATQHPLAASVQLAFDEHRPLRLTPDAVWLTIASGFAKHVEARSETLRSRFVRHQGRRTLAVEWRSSWEQVVDDFSSVLAEELGAAHGRLFRCAFSTTTETDRIASDIVFLATYQRYFDLLVVGICGIPQVHLAGTEADWRSIRERIEALAQYDAEHWVAALRPLADEWVESSAGRPDVAFWRAIYKPRSAYMEDASTGWVTQLFPYLEDGAPNPSIGTGGPETGYTYEALQLGTLPSGLVRVPVRALGHGTFDFYGGLAGVVEVDGVLSAESGWAIVQRDFSRLLERLEEEHELAPSTGVALPPLMSCPAQLRELYSCCGGGTLHDGRWRIRRPEDLETVHTAPTGEAGPPIFVARSATVFADLGDGRRVALMGQLLPEAQEADWWVVLLQADGPLRSDAPIIAKGFEAFLTSVLDEGDLPFFDEADFVPDENHDARGALFPDVG